MLLLRHVARRPHCQTRLVLIDNHPEEMTRSKLWLPFVCCFLLTRLAAQTAGPEDLYIHFNKSFYVSGEHIWAKVYFLGPLPEEASAVVYLDLIAPDGTVLVSDRLRRTGKYALWDRQIPYEWPSAYYLVRVYTRWNLQFGNDFVYTELLPIYHFPDEPVERPDEWGATKQGEAPAGPAGSGGLQIELLPLRETARSGEEVTLEFRVTDQAGRPVDASLSASVLDLDWLPEEADRPYRLADIWQRGRPEALAQAIRAESFEPGSHGPGREMPDPDFRVGLGLEIELELGIADPARQSEHGADESPDRVFGAIDGAAPVQSVVTLQAVEAPDRFVERGKLATEDLTVERFLAHRLRTDRQSPRCI